MKFIKYILFILVLFFLSCNKDDSNPSGSNSQNQIYPQMYPLAVGNEWVYETTKFLSTIMITDTVRCIGKYFENGDSIFSFYGGKKDYKMQYTFFQLTQDKEGFFYRNDSLFMLIKNGLSSFPLYKSYFISCSNPVVGQNDTVYLRGCNNLGWVRVLAIEEIITVPAGVFNCTKISVGGPNSCLSYSVWIAKNFGIVRIINRDIWVSHDPWDIVELVSYKLK